MITRRWLIDAGERTVMTFVEAAIALLIAAPAIDVSVLKSAAVAGGVAALAFVKSALARLVHNPESASLAAGV